VVTRIFRCVYGVGLIILASLLNGQSVSAQVRYNGIPYIKNYTHQEYGASPFNWAVVQDANGLIYVGNNYLLMEWDGNTWRMIALPNRTVVRSLTVDSKGRVYVGGQDDFGYLAPDEKGEMAFQSLKSKIEKQYQDFDDVWRIYAMHDGVVFCTASGIYYYQDSTIKYYSINHIIDLCFYVNDRLFITDHTRGIYEFRNGHIQYIVSSAVLKDNLIAGMLYASDGDILVVTQKKGIYKFDSHDTFTPWPIESQKFMEHTNIVTTAALATGYALGSSSNGVLIIDREGKTKLHLNKEKGLQNNGVEYIYTNASGNLWLALRDGVDFVEINSPFTLFNSQTKISGSAFTSLVKDHKLYLGTSDGLFCKTWDENQNPLTQTAFSLVENSEGQTYNLQLIDNHLILSHHTGAYEILNNKAVKISPDNGVWYFMQLRNNPKAIVCGTYTGLRLYENVNGTLVWKWAIAGFDESSRIMEQDDDGNIWIAHGYKGVYKLRLNKELNKVESVKLYNSKNGFPSDVFINVFKIDGKLVFTGAYGIYHYDEKTDRFVPHDEFNKLIDKGQHTRKLIQDKENNIWYSSGDEIGVLKRSNNGSYTVKKTIFNKLGKKLVGGFEHIAYYDPYNVIIGIDEGFVHYDPTFNDDADRSYNTLLRKVICTSAKDSLLSGGVFSELTGNPNQPVDKIPSLPYSLNSLRFAFSAMSYEDATSVQYQYILEGNDKNWSAWGRMTQKEYTNLREGDYIFRVKAKDIYNRIGSEASYKFTILSPWYRSIGAYIVYAILLGLLLYAVRKLTKIEQLKAMRLREAKQMEEVLKAEKEIIKLNSEKLEHDLHHKTKELTSSAIHIVHNIETIQKLKSQVLSVMETVEDKNMLYQLRKLSKSIESEISIENNWEQFENHFNQIHQDFLVRLRKEFPALTHGDIKLCAYLRLNLSSKEIAPLLNLSLRGVEASRYRIRKKMNLSQDINLTEFILRY